MGRPIYVFCAIALSATSVTATADDKLARTYGLGMSSCDALVQAFRQDSPNVGLTHQGRAFPSQAHTYQQWLAGFVSSYNIYISDTGNLGKVTDISGLMEWVHSYCQKHTTSSVMQAATKMIQSLERK